MKKLLQFGLVSLLLLPVVMLATAGSAGAHVLEQDNGVSAVLHIEPTDDPVAARPTPLQFEFANNVGSFRLADYDTKLVVIENNRLVHEYAVEPASASAGEASVTFPQAALYDVVLTGTPVVAGAPQFRLDYRVRVAGVTSTTGHRVAASLQVILISALSVILLTMVAVSNVRIGKKYAPPAPATKKSK